MHLQRGVNFFIIMLILCLGLFTTPAYAGDTINATSQATPAPLLTQDPVDLPRYPLMHLSRAQLEEEEAQYKSLETWAPVRQGDFMMDSAAGSATPSRSLLSYLSYIPSERNQGQCGDCWVWASTGALEIDRTVQTGIKERLSTQYFNSKYKSGGGAGWACCGGSPDGFTTWYTSDKSPIPWSNTNASFGDASRPCENYKTTIPLSTISVSPHYHLNSISTSPISTYRVGQSAAIANIRNAIDNDKAVYYSFNYNISTWEDIFFVFWGDQAESEIWDPDSYGGQEYGGGHAALIVGYDTSDPGNPYWIVLNSWGAPSGRPNGLFRLKMDMNYDNIITYDNFTFPQHTFSVLNTVFPPAYQIGVFRNSTHKFYLDTTGEGVWNAGDTLYTFGAAGDLPITGDWDNDGYTEIGVFRNSTHKFYLDTTGEGVWNAGDTLYTFGAAGDLPITGDWDNDGYTEIGVFRNSTHKFYLDTTGEGVWNAGDTLYTFGAAGDLPITGDWNSDGITEIGVFRNSTHKFYLDTSGDGVWNAGDTLYTFGAAGDLPITGDWNSDGITEIGVFRPSTHRFYLDHNRNGIWNGAVTDRLYNFGTGGDLPVSGT